MKILERNGFVQYSGNNLWIKYDYIDNKKVPILFSTVKKNGDVVITNNEVEHFKIFDSLFSRERLGSTGLGAEVAVPHGRIKGLKRPLMAVLRSAEGIAFDAPDGKPVRLLFVLLVPEAATEEHLELLSAIAELLSDRALRSSLMTTPSPADLLGILNAWEPYQPAS